MGIVPKKMTKYNQGYKQHVNMSDRKIINPKKAKGGLIFEDGGPEDTTKVNTPTIVNGKLAPEIIKKNVDYWTTAHAVLQNAFNKTAHDDPNSLKQVMLDKAKLVRLHDNYSQRIANGDYKIIPQQLLQQNFTPSQLTVIPNKVKGSFGTWIQNNEQGIIGGAEILGGMAATGLSGGLAAPLATGLITSGIGNVVGDTQHDQQLTAQKASQATAQAQAKEANMVAGLSASPLYPTVKRGGRLPVMTYKGRKHTQGGIPVDDHGNPSTENESAEVEGGETGVPTGRNGLNMGDEGMFVLSDHLTASPELTQKVNGGKLAKNTKYIKTPTYAHLSKMADKKANFRPYDKIDQDHNESIQKALVEENEIKRKMDSEGRDDIGKSGIHIKPENKGKLNATKKATGKSTEELTHSKNPVTRKRAIFAQNAAKWHHEDGGPIDELELCYGGKFENGGYNSSLSLLPREYAENLRISNQLKAGGSTVSSDSPVEYLPYNSGVVLDLQKHDPNGILLESGGRPQDKPGGSNVGKYKNVHSFAGPSGGAPKGSYPINTIERGRSALKLAHNAPNPSGIKAAVYRKYPSLKHEDGGVMVPANIPHYVMNDFFGMKKEFKADGGQIDPDDPNTHNAFNAPWNGRGSYPKGAIPGDMDYYTKSSYFINHNKKNGGKLEDGNFINPYTGIGAGNLSDLVKFAGPSDNSPLVNTSIDRTTPWQISHGKHIAEVPHLASSIMSERKADALTESSFEKEPVLSKIDPIDFQETYKTLYNKGAVDLEDPSKQFNEDTLNKSFAKSQKDATGNADNPMLSSLIPSGLDALTTGIQLMQNAQDMKKLHVTAPQATYHDISVGEVLAGINRDKSNSERANVYNARGQGDLGRTAAMIGNNQVQKAYDTSATQAAMEVAKSNQMGRISVDQANLASRNAVNELNDMMQLQGIHMRNSEEAALPDIADKYFKGNQNLQMLQLKAKMAGETLRNRNSTGKSLLLGPDLYTDEDVFNPVTPTLGKRLGGKIKKVQIKHHY